MTSSAAGAVGSPSSEVAKMSSFADFSSLGEDERVAVKAGTSGIVPAWIVLALERAFRSRGGDGSLVKDLEFGNLGRLAVTSFADAMAGNDSCAYGM